MSSIDALFCRSCGNVLLNGFEANLKPEDRKTLLPLNVGDVLHPSSSEKRTISFSSLVHRGACLDLRSKSRGYHCLPLSSTDFSETNPATDEKITDLLAVKCGLLAFAHTFQGVGLTLNLINRIIKVVSFAHFWHPSPNPYNFWDRTQELGKDLLRIVATPFAFLALFAAALYGFFSPFGGIRLYSTLENCMYTGGYQTFSITHELPEAILKLINQPSQPICTSFFSCLSEDLQYLQMDNEKVKQFQEEHSKGKQHLEELF